MKIKLIKSEIQVPYSNCLEFMEKQVSKIIEGDEKSQAIWFLEHPPIYTAGTNANENELLNPDLFPVFKTGRGGKFTYHGPGQRVVYLMLDIKKLHDDKPDIKKFVNQLEEWLILTLKDIGIEGYRNKEHIGIWVKNKQGVEKKIAAIGIRARKWVSFHGVALNVNPNMSHYQGIVPCGILDKGVTSIWQEGAETDISMIDVYLIKNFQKVFGCEINNIEAY
jgi:lipoyl(octanoyl) transferase